MLRLSILTKLMGMHAENKAGDPRGYLKLHVNTPLKLWTRSEVPNIVNISRIGDEYEDDVIGHVEAKFATILYRLMEKDTGISPELTEMILNHEIDCYLFVFRNRKRNSL